MTSVAYDGEPAPPLDDIHVQVKTVYIDISMFKMVPNLNTIVQSSIQNFQLYKLLLRIVSVVYHGY